MKLRALLVDDEFPARKELRFLLQDYPEIKVVGEAANATEALELITNMDYSVIFLDIDMPGVRGIDLATQLLEKEQSPAIIFITAHEEFALEAFSVNALDYLLKPINPKRLARAIQKLLSLKHHKEAKAAEAAPDPAVSTPLAPEPQKPVEASPRLLDVIPVEQRGKTLLLRPEEIVYIFTDKDSVFVKTQKESYLTRFTLKELESRLSPQLFFRSHRCYLVNIKRMREFIPYFSGTYNLVVDDNEKSEIPVSRTQARKLKEILGL